MRGRAPAPEGVAAARRARDRRRHEEEVLVAAEEVFARQGYHQASMHEIAAGAACSVGTLYNLFSSKERLFAALLLRHIEAVSDAIREAVERGGSARECLEEIAVAKARLAARRRTFFRLFTTPTPGVLSAKGVDPLPDVERAYARVHARIRGVFSEGLSSGELQGPLGADLLSLLYESATRAHVLEQVIKGSGEPDDEEVRSVVRVLLDGIATTRAPKRRGRARASR